MRKTKAIETKTLGELIEFLGLPIHEAVRVEFRITLNAQIIIIVEKQGLTHSQVAKLAKVSRKRMTDLLRGNIKRISTDLMLRVLGALGYRAKLSFSRAP